MTRQSDFMHPIICSVNWMYSPISSKTHSQSNLVIFLCASEAMWPVAHERKSPVGKTVKVGVQIPFRANFLFVCFFLTACLQFDQKQNTRSNLQMTTGLLQMK